MDSFEDPLGLIRFTYFTTSFCSINNLFFIIIIILKAPREMRIQSRYIAFTHFGAAFLDLNFGLFCPMRMTAEHDEISIQFVGILSFLNIDVRVQTILLFLSASIMSFSLQFLFIGALRRILPKDDRKRLALNFIALVSCLNGGFVIFLTAVPIFIDDGTEVQLDLIHHIIYLKLTTSVLFNGGTIAFIAMNCACFSFLISLIVKYFAILQSNLIISNATAIKQKLFLKNSLLQFSIPILFIGFPLAIRICSLFFHRTQALVDGTNFIQSFYGTIFTITTVFVYRPYRDFVVYKITCGKMKRKTRSMQASKNDKTSVAVEVK